MWRERTFPVETAYLGREEGKTCHGMSRVPLNRFLGGDRSGDILVFLPGEREIRECVDVLEDAHGADGYIAIIC
ncbi:hypothetical protein [Rubritalea tangerina]|uniref:hypothetical protein n=1 Tax=Rubritalea tangerina TaxID=430798 RepID=UPI0036070774